MPLCTPRTPRILACLLAALALCLAHVPAWGDEASSHLARLAGAADRSLGSAGEREAADYIFERFKALGYETVGRQSFLQPVRMHGASRLSVPEAGIDMPVAPLEYNAISPETVLPGSLQGPLVYVGGGELAEMDGKPMDGAIAVMRLASGKNWQNAAMLGARALIFVDPGESPRGRFENKRELTPVDFPCYHMAEADLARLFPDYRTAKDGIVARGATLSSDVSWKRVRSENVYCLIPGKDPAISSQMLLIDAFYDASRFVYGQAPGADEATGAATLLSLAEQLRRNPPGRSVLLVATSGQAMGKAGLREVVWALTSKGLYLRELERHQKSRVKDAEAVIAALDRPDPLAVLAGSQASMARTAVETQVKNEVDTISTALMRLRLNRTPGNEPEIARLAARRAVLRRLVWGEWLAETRDDERAALLEMIPRAIAEQHEILEDAGQQLECIESARELRSKTATREVAAAMSLHLSSHGDAVGSFSRGFMYNIRPDRNYQPSYSTLSQILSEAAPEVQQGLGQGSRYVDAIRPSRERPWHSFFLDRPHLGGEVTSMGGFAGITLATVNDARLAWGTPWDTLENVDLRMVDEQARLVAGLVSAVAAAPGELAGMKPRLGFGTLDGKAKFIRQGELFADRTAPGTVIQCYQGPAIYYVMADSEGAFQLKGAANKKVVVDKVVLEAYRFDDAGRIVWAVDKRQTGKDAYRVKMNLLFTETHLVMFACRQLTLFNLLEPRTFRHMTKIQLLDGNREAQPSRFWYSRVDTRESTLLSVFLEPGTPLKLTLSDTVLQRKLVLLGGTPEAPEGKGYLPSQWPTLPATEFRVAGDMWTLLGPRIENLERHGIVNTRIRGLRAEGEAALASAGQAFAEHRYTDAMESARTSWSLASRVYRDVEATQKDVLIGVLFYIALFVPFAWCVERIVFNFAGIHKRIVAFLGVLAAVIAVIYAVHPAFELTYSPLVVILAFFILGLSFLVSMIIFLRFESEMAGMQRRSHHAPVSEVSHWRAFASAFVIGVSNLRRRKVRTVLTCVTLIILTFTIMSFTSVKSVRESHSQLFRKDTPYHGVLLKNLGWKSLPPEVLPIVSNRFESKSGIAGARAAALGPRLWLENQDRTTEMRIPLSVPGHAETAGGLVALGPDEPRITGIDKTLTGGRWFTAGDMNAVLLPSRMAERLGIDPKNPAGAQVRLWGLSLTVVGVFDGDAWERVPDLDGEPLTPVIFPNETLLEMNELEAEAAESGEELDTVQSRYQHLRGDRVVVVPAALAPVLGASLRAVAIAPPEADTVRETASRMVDRFGLTLFAGERDGTYVHHAADAISYAGLPNILVPLAIAVFIVLNTMITSVYERKREIGVYTSLGMAPTHVSFLFIAEAVAFAVVSVVLGYLLAQIASQMLSGTAIWSGMTANYSSLSGVAAMALVISVVLISVIYPSRVAAQIAIPDVNRSWTMPEAEDDVMELTLPFLLKFEEQRCVGGFLAEYFKAHQDISHGRFSSADLDYAFSCPTPELLGSACLTMQARVWLAPFDFGVKQHVRLVFCPSPEHATFLEIKVRLKREAGETGAWKRINKGFLNDLRKQLLVWRSLSAEARDHYERRLADARVEVGTQSAESTARGGDER